MDPSKLEDSSEEDSMMSTSPESRRFTHTDGDFNPHSFYGNGNGNRTMTIVGNALEIKLNQIAEKEEEDE